MEPIFNHNWETSNVISFSLSQQKSLPLQIKSRAKAGIVCKCMSPPSEMSKMKNSLGDAKICLGGDLCDLIKCAALGLQS